MKKNQIDTEDLTKNITDLKNQENTINNDLKPPYSFQSKAALKDYSFQENSILTTSTSGDSSPDSISDKNENSNNSIKKESTIIKDISDENNVSGNIRRSDRIKTISQARLQSVGVGLVKDKVRLFRDDDKSFDTDEKNPSIDLEAENAKFLKDMEDRLSRFQIIKENEYRCERIISKEAKKMTCDCFLTRDEEGRGELGCGEDCLNRLLMIECSPKCTVGDRCTNRRFQRIQNAPCKVFKTEKKGFGLMADSEILPGQFIMEYVGEVLNTKQFEKRANVYSNDHNKHYYFMALRSDAIIDATQKGNISRFINHSCDPNAETQKWTVNGELRIGFFSKKEILPGEEITFDYQFQRYGREAQKCFCESENCRGWIGEEPESEEEYEDEDEESESEEESEKKEVDSKLKINENNKGIIKNDEISSKEDEENIENKKVTKSSITSTTTTTAKKRKRVRVKKIKTKPDFSLLDAFADPDLENDIASLMRTGLKNQAHTLCLSRLMVRAKILDSRTRLLEILRKGEAPCKRLFLDYHGLRLLHGWMIEIETNDVQRDIEYRHQLLETFETLPIPNKTMLKDSKVFEIIQAWADEKPNNIESSSPTDESSKETTNTDSKISSIDADNTNNTNNTNNNNLSLQNEIIKISKRLIKTWENLPEVFRIPKRERIEQMKEHEREADRQYKALNLSNEEDNERLQRKRNKERFGSKKNYKPLIRESFDRKSRDHKISKDSDKTYSSETNLTKEQRRQLFEAKVAKDEAEKRLTEERREFEVKCKFFGLDPNKVLPENLPFCVNPVTGQWYTKDRKPIPTPPSHV